MKKRRMIDIPRGTLDVLARCAAVLKPPPELTLSQWADRYRVLSAESSAEPGRWHTDKAPYQREIMDAIGDPHIRKVVIMSAAQIGKTDAFILNPLGYYRSLGSDRRRNGSRPPSRTARRRTSTLPFSRRTSTRNGTQWTGRRP